VFPDGAGGARRGGGVAVSSLALAF
jgi:hypothetical protein